MSMGKSITMASRVGSFTSSQKKLLEDKSRPDVKLSGTLNEVSGFVVPEAAAGKSDLGWLRLRRSV